MTSRVIGISAAVLALLGGAIVWRLAVSDDSDFLAGLIAAAPLFALAALLAVVGSATRRSRGNA